VIRKNLIVSTLVTLDGWSTLSALASV